MNLILFLPEMTATEGTLPEKPYPCQGAGDEQYFGARQDEYNAAIEALKEQSIGFEDEVTLINKMSVEAKQSLTHLKPDAYQIDLNVESVWQCKNSFGGWTDVTYEYYMDGKDEHPNSYRATWRFKSEEQPSDEERGMPTLTHGVVDEFTEQPWHKRLFCKKCELITEHVAKTNACIICGTVNDEQPTEEPKLFPLAKEQNKKDGWTYDYRLLSDISEYVESKGENVSMEAADFVLEYLDKRVGEEPKPETPSEDYKKGYRKGWNDCYQEAQKITRKKS